MPFHKIPLIHFHVDMIVSCNFYTFMLRISHTTMSQRCSVRFRSGEQEGHWRTVNSFSCSWNQVKTTFALWQCISMLEIAIRRQGNCGHDGVYMVSNNTQIGSKFWSFHLCASAKIKSHQTRLCFLVFNYPVMACPLQPQISVLAWKKWNPMVFLLLKPICLKIRCAVHFGMLCCSPQLCRVVIWVTVSFLSAFCLAFILHLLLSSRICFRPQNCHCF